MCLDAGELKRDVPGLENLLQGTGAALQTSVSARINEHREVGS